MRIEQLEQAIKVATTGSISRAAKELYLSQSNLSQSIKSLEAELKQPIFRRTPVGVELTEFGGEFLNYARPAYSQFQLLSDFCRQTSQGPPLSFSVACQYLRFAHILFIELCTRYKEFQTYFSFLECSFLDIVENVYTQKSELGVLVISKKQKRITLQLLKNKGLVYHAISEYPASVTIGAHNPLYHKEENHVTLEELEGFPLIMYQDMNFSFISEMEELDIHTKKNRIIVSDRATMHEYLQHTDAYSIAASTHAYRKAAYYQNIRALELTQPRFTLEIGYIHNLNRPLSAIAQEYVKALEGLLLP